MTATNPAPIPFFSGPFEAAYTSTLTFTYPTGGTDYDVVITAGDTFDSIMDLLFYIRDELEDHVALQDVFWLYPSSTGLITILSTGSNFDLAETTSAPTAYKILNWLGLDTAGYSNRASITGDSPHKRGFYPLLPLMEAPVFSRSLNPATATYRLLSGGVQYSASLAPQGGFTSARFRVQYLEDTTAIDTSEPTDQQLYTLLGFLTGVRAPAEDIDYGGNGFLTSWTGNRSEDEAIDSLQTGGLMETRFTYFEEWINPSDYDTYDDYELAHVGSQWHLHPDLREVVIYPKYVRDNRYWLTEWHAYQLEG